MDILILFDFYKKLYYNNIIESKKNKKSKEVFDMDEEEMITIPYYETVYLDDNNIKHLAKIKDTESLMFMKNRFEILQCDYVKEN